jgi:hypothetical protein
MDGTRRSVVETDLPGGSRARCVVAVVDDYGHIVVNANGRVTIAFQGEKSMSEQQAGSLALSILAALS